MYAKYQCISSVMLYFACKYFYNVSKNIDLIMNYLIQIFFEFFFIDFFLAFIFVNFFIGYTFFFFSMQEEKLPHA